jgi:CO dehydrogenase maturation factor
MDNEAGMEHISRLTTRNVDLLLLVSDTSRRGIQAATRINKLAAELNIGFKESGLIINRCKTEPPDKIRQILAENDLKLLGTLPDDNTVYEYDFEGRPTVEIPAENPAIAASEKIFETIIP